VSDSSDDAAQPDTTDEVETVDVLPVLAQEASVVGDYPFSGQLSRSSNAMPTVQAAAVAAGGFVAGAAVVGLVTRRQRRSAVLAKGRSKPRHGRRRGAGTSAAELVQIVGSRSLLVDVHLLGGRG
jgi:hypothetical protein